MGSFGVSHFKTNPNPNISSSLTSFMCSKSSLMRLLSITLELRAHMKDVFFHAQIHQITFHPMIHLCLILYNVYIICYSMLFIYTYLYFWMYVAIDNDNILYQTMSVQLRPTLLWRAPLNLKGRWYAAWSPRSSLAIIFYPGKLKRTIWTKSWHKDRDKLMCWRATPEYQN